MPSTDPVQEYNDFIGSAVANLERLPQWVKDQGIQELIDGAVERMAARRGRVDG